MKKRTILLGALAMILVAAVSVGGTLAYLTASASVTNTFTVGDVEISLTESQWDSVTEHKLVPGTTIAKDPTVIVKANSEDCYVRVKVTVPEALEKLISPLDIDTENWAQETGTDFYRYVGDNSGIVTSSDTDNPLPAVFNNVTIKGEVTGEQLAALDANDRKITVEAYAIQSASFADADAAWTAFTNTVTPAP